MTYLDWIHDQPCVLCGLLNIPQSSKTSAHHMRHGQGMAQRSADWLAMPLCHDCHQGPTGIHGDRSLLKIAKVTEQDLLAATVKRLYNFKLAIAEY